MKKSMLIKDYEREVKSKQKRHKGKKRLKVILNTIGEIDSEVWSTIGILFLGGIIIVGMIMAFANIVRKEQPHAQKLEQEFNLIINNVEEGARAQSIFFKREWRLGFNNDNVPKGDLIIVTENNTDESLSPKIELAEKNGKKVSIVYEFEGKYYSAIETKDTVVKKDNKEDLIIYGGIQELQKAVQDKINFLKRDGVSKLKIGWFMPNGSEKGIGYKKFNNYYSAIPNDETYPVIFEVKVSNKI